MNTKRVKTLITIPKNWLKQLWNFTDDGKGLDLSVQALRLYINIVFFKDPLRNGSRTLTIKETNIREIIKISKKDRLYEVLNEVGFIKKYEGTWEYTLKEYETYTLGKNIISPQAWEVIPLNKIWRSIEAQKELITYKLFFYLLNVGTYTNKKRLDTSSPVHVINLDKLLYRLNIRIKKRKDLTYRYKNKVIDTLDFFKELGFIYDYECKGRTILILSKELSPEEVDSYLYSFRNVGFIYYEERKKKAA